MQPFNTLCMKKILMIIFLFSSISMTGCHCSQEKKAIEIDADTTDRLTYNKPLVVDGENYTDPQGRKQGLWIKSLIMKNDTIINKHTYRNDTLNGSFAEGGRYSRIEGYYKNGQFDSVFYCISDNKEVSRNYQMVQYFSNGIIQWAAFGYDQHLIFPEKGFSFWVDNVYIRVPYYNGKLWYEGEFSIVDRSLKTKCTDRHVGVGIHKVYYENGDIHALIDYDKLTVKLYDPGDSHHFVKYSFTEFRKVKNCGIVFKYVEDKYWPKPSDHQQ